MKATKTTFKKFIKETENLFIGYRQEHSENYDGNTNSIRGKNIFMPIETTDIHMEHTYGIRNIWLVGSGRDYFETFTRDGMDCISIDNCCGVSILAKTSATA